MVSQIGWRREGIVNLVLSWAVVFGVSLAKENKCGLNIDTRHDAKGYDGKEGGSLKLTAKPEPQPSIGLQGQRFGAL